MGAIHTAAFLLTATLLAATPSRAEVDHQGGSWAADVVATPSLARSPTFLDRGAIREPARKRVRRQGVKLKPKPVLHSPVLAKATNVRVVQRHTPRTRVARAASSRPVTTGGIRAQTARAHVGEHRIVIQVTQNDTALMNVALNNAQNLLKHYEAANEKVQVEFVAYGPGLHMVRSDTSPVKERLSGFARDNPKVVFSGCGNTMVNQSKQENKPISLIPEARVVPTGIGRIVELQEQGWTYVRP